MGESTPGALPLSRRNFLSGLAIACWTPLLSRAEATPWFAQEGHFTGDDMAQAHRLFMRLDERLAAGNVVRHQERRDVIVVGGGVAGLVTAYTLVDRDVLLFEGAPSTGGVAKTDSWRGLDYALGAAYIIDPDPESEDARERRGFRLLETLGLRERGEDLTTARTKGRRLGGEANHCVFSNRRVVPAREVYPARTDAFFRHVLDSDRYPSVPTVDDALVRALDRVSFAAFLRNPALQRRIYGRTAGPIPAIGWEAIEYYCWGAFGASASETSAYHGLNFFAAEYGDLLIYPGGNGFITRRLAERLAPRNVVRTDAWVLRIEPTGDGGHAVTTHEKGQLHRYEARAVVFASPLLLAPRLIPALPEPQRQAIATFDYRAYVVANVLLGRRIDEIFQHRAFRSGYELTRVLGADVASGPIDRHARANGFSDAIAADFATGRHATSGVLTVYRPYPYASGRAEVMSSRYGDIQADVHRAILEGFGRHGLRKDDILETRISRWGHAMIVAKPGQLADGTLDRARAPLPGLWFAHTDVQGAPAYENAIAAAFDAADAVDAYLRR